MAHVIFGGQPCVDPTLFQQDCARLGMPTDWYGKPNSFLCPLGVKPGQGWLLMARQHLDRLDLDTPHDLVFTVTDAVRHQKTTVTLRNLLVADPALCLSPGYRHDPRAAYLVPLTDRRKVYGTIPIDRAYNLRRVPGSSSTSDSFSSTLNSGALWTWAEMVQDVWETVGTSRLGAFPGLPYTPDGTPENYHFWASYALDALDVILAKLDCALDWDPIADTYTIVQLGAADSQRDSALARYDHPERVWDLEHVQPNRTRIPEKLRVRFHRSRTSPDATGASLYHLIDQTDPTSGGPLDGTEPGSVLILEDDLEALYDSSGTLTNLAALTARAAERAETFFTDIRTGRIDRTYGALLSAAGLRPGRRLRETWWGDVGGGYETRVIWRPSVWRPVPGVAGTTWLDYKLNCEDGVLRRYQRTVCLTLVEDQPIAVPGDWTYESDQGCCDCPSTSGSSSSSSSSSLLSSSQSGGSATCHECPTCPGQTPLTWEFFVNNFTGGCTPYNGAWLLTQDPNSYCVWSYSGDGVTITLTVSEGISHPLSFSLTFEGFGTVTYQGDADDCCTSLRVTQVDSACGGDATIDLGPSNCCGPSASSSSAQSSQSSSSCTPITVSELDLRCESGIINLYQRTITINVSDGCLTKTTGDWVFLRSEGCCDCPSSSSSSHSTSSVQSSGTSSQTSSGGSSQGSSAGSSAGSAGSSSSSSGIGTACCPNPLPSSLTVTVTNKTGDCTCLPDSLTITYIPASHIWGGNSNACMGLTGYYLSCDQGTGLWSFYSTGDCLTTGTTPDAGETCSPLHLVFSNKSFSGCCMGTATFTVTE